MPLPAITPPEPQIDRQTVRVLNRLYAGLIRAAYETKIYETHLKEFLRKGTKDEDDVGRGVFLAYRIAFYYELRYSFEQLVLDVDSDRVWNDGFRVRLRDLERRCNAGADGLHPLPLETTKAIRLEVESGYKFKDLWGFDRTTFYGFLLRGNN